jgi:hypothetical protein
MPLATEIEKIRDAIKQVEDPAVAMALRHVCKALDELQEGNEKAASEKRRKEEVPH